MIAGFLVEANGWMVVPFTGLGKTGEGTGFEGKKSIVLEYVKFERPSKTVKKLII